MIISNELIRFGNNRQKKEKVINIPALTNNITEYERLQRLIKGLSNHGFRATEQTTISDINRFINQNKIRIIEWPQS